VKVELIAIGSELLLGQSTDTNSVWLSEQLALYGIDCHHHSTVGDNLDRMVVVMSQALNRSDVVICTGGLGPTQDDITRDAIAKVMKVNLKTDPSLVAAITDKFKSRNREMSENNLLQAMVPVGGTPLAAMPGTAPGLNCPVQSGGHIYAFPGVPSEMKQMFSQCVLPELLKSQGGTKVIRSRTMRTWGMTESGLAELLDPMIKSLDINQGSESSATLAFLASGVEGLKVRITVKGDSSQACDRQLDLQEQQLRELIGPIIFGTNTDTMESVVIDLLRDKGMTLSVAESLTGGYLAGRICDIAGASQVFVGGVVAYSGGVKQKLLGLDDGPVVSEAAAIEMAKNIRDKTGSSLALSTTGVAGPSEYEGKSVGTVCIGLAGEDFAIAETIFLPKSRQLVRQLTTITALNILRKYLIK